MIALVPRHGTKNPIFGVLAHGLLAFATICPWSLVPFFQISLKNSELKTTHITFRDCRVHFFLQPLSK